MERLGVKDLNRLLRFLADLGYTVSEGPHAVLPDGSEVGHWILTRGSRVVGQVIAHYVDSHYYVLMKTEGAPDREVLEALVGAEARGVWRVPVEDVVVVADPEVLEALVKYSDELPSEEAAEALSHYEKRATKFMDRFLERLREASEERGEG